MSGINKNMEGLIIKYLQGTLSAAEQMELENRVHESPDNKALFERLTDQEWVSAELQKLYQYDEEEGWGKIKKSFPFKVEAPVRKYYWKRLTIAASVVGLLFMAGYWLLKTGKDLPGKQEAIVVTGDIEAPKSSKAMITLSNGQTILLDSITNGMLAKQGNVNVVKTTDGRIIYSGDNSEIVYNTLFNPRGSEVVNLTLSDGTKVWLNSESSLRYPVAFAGNERKIEITGEAYFEVAKDAARKFIVDASGVITEVLGTHFNVNTYSDEASTKITLLEGSVKVAKGASTCLLKPGQQAQVTAVVSVMDNIDTDEVMAWKNGRFQFGEKADVASIMRQISRWYDIEVEYKGTVTGHIGGGISRNVNALQVLKMLETTGVAKFRIEGKKVIVSP